MKEEHKRLVGYGFRLLVDGMDLRKPVRLRANPNGYTVVKFPVERHTVYGRSVSFDGYLIVNESLEIKPAELRGILIRIKNVAIGYYDGTLLDYRFNEGPRSRWVTGEVFVHEGLENALNIDRDSFNQFHPEFRVVQEFVHKQAREQLFAEVYRKLEKRSKRRAAARDETRSESLRSTLSAELGKDVRFRTSGTKSPGLPAVTVKASAKRLRVTLPPEDEIRTSPRNRKLAAAILTIFESALRQKNPVQQRSLFTRLLLRLLRDW